MSDLSYVVRRVTDFWTRTRSLGYALTFLGASILIALCAGLSLEVRFPTPNGPATLSLNTNAGFIAWIAYIIAAVGCVLVSAGLFRLWQEWKALDRKRVFAVELRGLRDWSGPPLSESVPGRLIGRREPVIIDMRQKVADGLIVDPHVAVQKTSLLRQDLDMREAGIDRRDISYVVGGLAPVPLMFLAGILIDDESPVTIMDWDRQQLAWRELDEADDGARFQITGLENVGAGTSAVIAAISASYGVDLAGVQAKCGALPLVHLQLENASTSSHWSEAKQQALGQQFLDTALELERRGAREVHLFFAGPASLVLRFGKLYDKRNLPSVTVYQYERGLSPPYPWGVRMPVAGNTRAEVITGASTRAA